MICEHYVCYENILFQYFLSSCIATNVNISFNCVGIVNFYVLNFYFYFYEIHLQSQLLFNNENDSICVTCAYMLFDYIILTYMNKYTCLHIFIPKLIVPPTISLFTYWGVVNRFLFLHNYKNYSY